MGGEPIDPGRYEIVKLPAARGAFKTPTLRDVAQRPPYMHDGSLPTLQAVVAFYNRGGAPNRALSPLVRPLALDDGKQADLVAFLEALTGEIDPWLGQCPALPPDPW